MCRRRVQRLGCASPSQGAVDFRTRQTPFGAPAVIELAQTVKVAHEIGKRLARSLPAAEENLPELSRSIPEMFGKADPGQDAIGREMLFVHALTEHLPVMADRAVRSRGKFRVIIERACRLAGLDKLLRLALARGHVA